jgi:hypothetical protein
MQAAGSDRWGAGAPSSTERREDRMWEMKRAVLLGGLVLLLVASLAPAAVAGEVKGPPGEGGAQGGSTPIENFWMGQGAASICAFSGLNDVIDEEEPTQTQSYGTFLVMIKQALGVSTAEAKAILGETPADLCNPTRAPWGNLKKG